MNKTNKIVSIKKLWFLFFNTVVSHMENRVSLACIDIADIESLFSSSNKVQFGSSKGARKLMNIGPDRQSNAFITKIQFYPINLHCKYLHLDYEQFF